MSIYSAANTDDNIPKRTDLLHWKERGTWRKRWLWKTAHLGGLEIPTSAECDQLQAANCSCNGLNSLSSPFPSLCAFLDVSLEHLEASKVYLWCITLMMEAVPQPHIRGVWAGCDYLCSFILGVLYSCAESRTIWKHSTHFCKRLPQICRTVTLSCFCTGT